jgi:hypothetical protein
MLSWRVSGPGSVSRLWTTGWCITISPELLHLPGRVLCLRTRGLRQPVAKGESFELHPHGWPINPKSDLRLSGGMGGGDKRLFAL